MRHAARKRVLVRRTVATGLAVLVGAATAFGQTVNMQKVAKVKAAYLYNFAKFVTWPEDAFDGENAPIQIGVLSDDSLGAVLADVVKNERIGNRPLVTHRLHLRGDDAVDAAALRQCHVLYIGDAYSQQQARILRLIDGADVLVVGEGESAARTGAMIAFVLHERKIAFYINRDAIELTRVRVSAKLMALAKAVYSEQRS